MFRFLKNLFRKSPSATGLSAFPHLANAAAGGARPSEVNVPVPRVETAQLSLAAIMAKFPEELRKLVLKMPPADAMVVMPLPAIQRSLPTGSVKMSLASVVRQAPPGTFSTINPQDKRTVDVPLAEIFKRISPAVLKKRPDQKLTDLAADGFDIFGDDENPHALAPRVQGEAAAAVAAASAPKPPTLGAPRVLKTQPGVVTAPPPDIPAPFAPLPAPVPAPAPAMARAPQPPAAMPAPPIAPAPMRAVAPPPEVPALFSRQSSAARQKIESSRIPTPKPTATPPVAPAGPSGDQPPLVISLKELAANWPEPIKSEAAAFNGATVALPSSDVSAGLARGKVSFAWGQLRSWLNPPTSAPSQGNDSIELILPLRVIAPAFLKHSKGAAPARKAAEVGDIPELFAGGNPPPASPAPVPAAPEPIVEEQPEEPVARAIEPEPTQAEPEVPASVEPAPVEEPVEEVSAPVAEAAPMIAEPEPIVEEAPAVEEAPSPEPTPAAEIVEESAPAADFPVEAETPSEPPIAAAPETVAQPAPAAAPVAADAPISAEAPKTLGELFGQPDKESWLPTEVVKNLVGVPGIAGALVALQEGLVIAHKLPEPLKGEVFAAFLPQIFARLNQYSGEMKLGGVSEIVIHANGGPCHLFRRGQVYFAALGHPEGTLPVHILRLCADAVAS